MRLRIHKWNWSALIAQLLCVGLLFIALAHVNTKAREQARISWQVNHGGWVNGEYKGDL